jgi:hypothetical protein
MCRLNCWNHWDVGKQAIAHMYVVEDGDLIEGIRNNFERRFVAINGGNWKIETGIKN